MKGGRGLEVRTKRERGGKAKRRKWRGGEGGRKEKGESQRKTGGTNVA